MNDQPTPSKSSCDILVVGAGAAGLLAALAARRAVSADGRLVPVPPGAPNVVILNNEARVGLKILVSGGGRCNVTNTQVDERDYDTQDPHLVRRLLRGFPPASMRNFFESQDCPLYEEPLGKLFPVSNRAKDVLGVLLDAVAQAGISIVAPAEVADIEEVDDGLSAKLTNGTPWFARRIILATGGRSLPKTGSRGWGLEFLRGRGHDLEPAFPALTGLHLSHTNPLAHLAGLTVPAVLSLSQNETSPDQLAGKKYKPLARSGGSLLVTHKGATGPAPFDVSGPAGRALAARNARLTADFWSLTLPEGPWAPYLDLKKSPGASLRPHAVPRPPTRLAFEAQAQQQLAHTERSVANAFGDRLPRSLLQALLNTAGLDAGAPLKQLSPLDHERLWLALSQADLQIVGLEGYEKAEVTSGGVRLSELFPATLESRRFPNLHCCGEVVDATGRLGGFNFQWAWSSGFAAGRGAATALSETE